MLIICVFSRGKSFFCAAGRAAAYRAEGDEQQRRGGKAAGERQPGGGVAQLDRVAAGRGIQREERAEHFAGFDAPAVHICPPAGLGGDGGDKLCWCVRGVREAHGSAVYGKGAHIAERGDGRGEGGGVEPEALAFPVDARGGGAVYGDGDRFALRRAGEEVDGARLVRVQVGDKFAVNE